MHAVSATTERNNGLIALRVLRAPQWFWFVVLPLAAALELDPTRLALAFSAAAACLAYSYALNAIAERHTDTSALKNPLVGLSHIPRSVTVTLIIVLAFALISAALLGLPSLAAASLSLLAGTLYSIGPRLKAWPGAGLVANTLIFVPLLILGVSGRQLPSAFPNTLFVFTALLLQNQLVHELADAREDEAAKALTTARSLGIFKTRMLISLIAVAALTLTHSWIAAVGITLPTLITFVRAEFSTLRRAHRFASIAAGAVLFLSGWAS